MQTLAQSPAPSAHARHAPRPAAGTRWAPAALALLLAACVHSPQAAVTAPAQPLTGGALNAAAGCQETPAARAALQAVTQELQAQGMAFRAAALLFGERRLHLAMAHNTLPTDARTRDTLAKRARGDQPPEQQA